MPTTNIIKMKGYSLNMILNTMMSVQVSSSAFVPLVHLLGATSKQLESSAKPAMVNQNVMG